jgi:Ca2+-binding EF-hand superfamily protein
MKRSIQFGMKSTSYRDDSIISKLASPRVFLGYEVFLLLRCILTEAFVIHLSPPFKVLSRLQRQNNRDGCLTFILPLNHCSHHHHRQRTKSLSMSRDNLSNLIKQECDVYGCIDASSDNNNYNNMLTHNHTESCQDVQNASWPMPQHMRRQGRRLRRRLQRALQNFLPGNEDAAMTNHSNTPYNTATEDLFDSIDRDRDGFLTEDEFLSAGYRLTNKDLGAMDSNQDGRLSKAELRQAVLDLYSSGSTDTSQRNIADEIDDILGDLEPLERQEMRLEGFEPYILVSVLTAEGSFGMISEMNNVEWDYVADRVANGQHLDQIFLSIDWLTIAILFSAGFSTVTGIYATTVFSLCILYGKTALGMSRDAEYYKFMDVTGMQRSRAFQAFSWALLTFSTSVLLLVALRSPPPFRLPLAGISLVILFFGIQEYESIVQAARPIFIPSSERRRSQE